MPDMQGLRIRLIGNYYGFCTLALSSLDGNWSVTVRLRDGEALEVGGKHYNFGARDLAVVRKVPDA